MNKNKSLIATLIAVVGSIIIALIANAEKISIVATSGLYIIFIICIIGLIWISYLLLKRKRKKNIKDHPIFTQFMYWNRYLNNSFTLEDKGRELLFREILNVHIDSFRKKLVMLHENTKNINNIVEFKNKHICILYEIIDSLEKHFNDSMYSDEDKNLLNLVIPKFNKWCDQEYTLITERIEEICESDLYTSNLSRNIVILLSYQIMISIIILNTSKTLDKLNGELSGLRFKGVLIK